ncbi:class 1b ribonucleoside-diphosphate reductase subunit beta [Thermoactinomyces sp. DSM 45892]|uniref:class 1b ribonucleoside-diphosphate reductase subunit beta n=1 Tax=Thermoactinomyces sp. DSM 45892 TaxID=1882753 RepID=UPI00089535B1|nr:class 1b ribonucleoside-diphosphate reductase subunit beta [Thermoactinomyces sp. DSM 45892]SDX93521.1 ribonucleoside-diphosphate reductase beta chain [Thermoactinomyces sp. DSM 45892]
MKIHKAINYNTKDDDYTLEFLDQNFSQMWLDTEFVPTKDHSIWKSLTEDERDVYKKVLGGLTLLDTKQSTIGMPKIAENVEGLQRKALLSFMGMMEAIHAKSYSTIFTTLLNGSEIDEVFEWVERNQYLQHKAQIIEEYYESIVDRSSLYMAMVASVFLESFLFYSGFFYPLYLAGGGGAEDGKGRMIASGEIINLIIRDESIHGLYVGKLAQETYDQLSDIEKDLVSAGVMSLLAKLMENEYRYTEDLYSTIGLDHEVKAFLHYNANKALMNLGLEPIYKEQEINPIILNGLSTQTKTHDFFSTKGNGYIKTVNVESLTDEDFVFDRL